MSVEISGGVVRLAGNVPVGDAETLLTALQEDPSRTVELGQAAHLHSAVIQLLLALRPRVSGTPSAAFLSSYILPMLDPGKGTA